MFIGIDLGTSSVKLLLVDETGNVKKSVFRTYPIIYPNPGWTEQDPNLWLEQTIDGLKELTKNNKLIKSISFSGQMHGLVLLDKKDHVLRNAILWNDQRTIKEVEYLNDNLGDDFLLKETGNIALTGLTLPKLLWVKNNEPEVFAKIDKIMLPKDYLAYKLTGVFASDVSDLSGTLLFDVKNKKYSNEILNRIGLKEQLLPKVFESYESIGNLSVYYEELLEIKNVKVVIGGGDQAVGAVGVGVVEDGTCSISLGTSGVVFVSSNNYLINSVNHLQSYAHSNGSYHIMGVMLNAAGALKWWLETIQNKSDYTEFFQGIDHTPLDNDVYFLPYLNGERAPFNNPNAKGVFFGLSSNHKKEDLNRAIVEGVTFSIKNIFDQIQGLGTKFKYVRITGGGAKSISWLQMIANVLNLPVQTLNVDEGPAFGAAILAMVGYGLFKNVNDACAEMVKSKERILPQIKSIMTYDKKHQRFNEIHNAVKDLFLTNTI